MKTYIAAIAIKTVVNVALLQTIYCLQYNVIILIYYIVLVYILVSILKYSYVHTL